MKRTLIIVLAALMLTGALTACSGTVGMDDGRAYGNVSTTPNGYVNGGDYNGYAGYDNYNGSNGGSSYNGSGSGYQSGTGMTGGR